ncbi:permease [Paenibacillus sp. HJGM_3]|uniref:permease n=1 Tax=Paenibacillus sp. HJGM_3 TaxID=3379816 RepID=UPI00385FB4E7
MRSFSYGSLAIHCFFIMVLSAVIVVAMNPVLYSSLPTIYLTDLQAFKTIFISIILEAFPFMLLGVLVSSFMQVFISEKTIGRFIPSNPLMGVLFACVLGVIFPICECGLIPVIRRLMAKGMPLYIAVVFIFVGPIVNPVVFAATYTAFRNKPELVYSRMGLALLVGAVIGLIIYRWVRINPLKNRFQMAGGSGHTHGSDGKLLTMFGHAADEFFDMGKYLMFGSLIAASIQTFVPRSELMELGQGGIGSHFFMMGLAYVLSLCSTSDAFVASSFASTFSAGSILTFLVFGPMLDLKSTIMLGTVFRARFVVFLAAVLVGVVFIGSVLFETFLL